MIRILIIDDDKDICAVLSKFLKKNGYEVEVANNGDEGLKKLRASTFALVLCDYRLPDMTGVEILRKIKLLQPQTSVIIITGYSDVKTAVETFKYGASDYVTKPLYPEELLLTLKETLAKDQSKPSNEKARLGNEPGKQANAPAEYVVGGSEEATKLQRGIELVAPSELSVIITGETGTGKEFVAKSIHRLSVRSAGPFIAIDCGALPRELAGSELFGHVKGAFTGAVNDKPGSFELANSGTLFMDEIGNLSYENQINLLRVLQERRLKRIGAIQDVPFDVRIIAATNEDLSTAVKDGRFREDLYHRLNEFKIDLAPLRERSKDIMTFANHFLSRANHSMNKAVRGFSDPVIKLLTNYHWHGNLRELNNVVKRAVLLTSGDTVQLESLPQEITNQQTPAEDAHLQVDDKKGGLLKSVAGSAEKQMIIEMLEKNKYNKSRVAELLKIDRKTLYNKLRLYNIQF